MTLSFVTAQKALQRLADITQKKVVIASSSEKEVERLLRRVLPGTPWENRAHAVGGYVRDEVMGLEAKDLDIVVEQEGGAQALTSHLHELFPNDVTTPHQMGASYPIWQVTFKNDVRYNDDVFKTKGAVIEFADTMKEGFPDPSSRQRATQPGTLNDDVERRDFTVNMLLKDLTTGEIVDMTGVSKDDIKNGVLRGHPNVSLDKIFSDDPLRMVRLVRFQCKYGWKIPLSVMKTVKRNAERIKIVSAERVMGELTKVMKLGKLDQAVRLMKATGLLQYVLPEVQNMLGVTQSPEHHSEGDVFHHTVEVLKHAPATIEGQLSALLHDVGKPSSKTIVDGAIKFLGHEETSAEIAEAVLRRLKFDSATIQKVVTVVRNHMRPYSLTDSSDKAIRKFIRELGDELADAVLEQAHADERGSHPNKNEVQGVKDHVKKVRESPVPVQRKPVLNGHELMLLLGINNNDKDRLPELGEAGRFLLDLADERASEGQELTKEEAEREVRKKFLKR